MSMRTLASLAVALVLGLIAVIMVRGMIASKQQSMAHAGATSPVVVAAVPLARGAQLQPAMLKVVNYPADAVPTGAFTSVEAAASKTALRPIAANEPVLTSKLSGAAGKSTLSADLHPGMRAISVRSSDVAGVGGFVLPGDRVDILITRTTGDDATSTITQALAENALVLGVDQTSDQETDKPVVAKAVTVEVTPEQAQAISLGQSVGQVTLSLRSVSDESPLGRRVTRVADLSGGAPAVAHAVVAKVRRAAPAPVRASLTQVNVTRGVETSQYPVGTR